MSLGPSAPARIGKQARSLETRQKLVTTAIELLATHGYAATTMTRVASAAGISAGPRRYYFPNPADLFAAVVDEIHTTNQTQIGAALAEQSDLQSRLRAQFLVSLGNVGSPQHMAMLELKMAIRGDPDLRRAIGPKIRAYEERADNRFLHAVRETGLPEGEIVALRAIMAATLRGLAIAAIERDQTDIIADVARLIPEMVTQRLRAGGQGQD